MGRGWSVTHKAQTKVVYAAFASNGLPLINVWHTDRAKLVVLLSDRLANGEAAPGEFIERLALPVYNWIRRQQGLSPIPLIRPSDFPDL